MSNFTVKELKQLINDRVKYLREHGINSELHVAPYEQNIRRFVPRQLGKRICKEDIPGFCVVVKMDLKKSQEIFSRKLEFYKGLID